MDRLEPTQVLRPRIPPGLGLPLRLAAAYGQESILDLVCRAIVDLLRKEYPTLAREYLDDSGDRP